LTAAVLPKFYSMQTTLAQILPMTIWMINFKTLKLRILKCTRILRYPLSKKRSKISKKAKLFNLERKLLLYTKQLLLQSRLLACHSNLLGSQIQTPLKKMNISAGKGTQI